MEKCQYCTRGEMCEMTQPEITPPYKGKLVCTRERGHTGPHVACGSRDHVLAAWDNNGKDVRQQILDSN